MFNTEIGSESPALERELHEGSKPSPRDVYFAAAKRRFPDRPDGELLEIADRLVKAEAEGKQASIEDYLDAARAPGDGT